MTHPATRSAAPAVAVDAVAALAMTALVQAAVWGGVGVMTADEAGVIAGRPALVALLFLPGTLALFWRRRAPHVAAILFAAAMAIHALSTRNTPEGTAILFPTLVAVYALGAHGTTRQALLAWPALVVAFTLQAAYDRVLAEEVWGAAFFWLTEAGAYSAGLLVAARRHGARLRSDSTRARAEREALTRTAVADERARIARELHDAVARSVSVTVIHAEAAEEVLPTTGADSARASLHRIQDSGREALTEIRQMVGLLRSPDGDDLAPQPGLRDLGHLAAETTAAGFPVELTILGDPAGLPPGIDMSAYRIVQEALTNALKHGADRALVHVTRDAGGLAIEVRDRPSAGPARVRAGTPMSGGHGLVGIRERVHFFGGELTAGPHRDGGFGVRVLLPCPDPGKP